MSQSQLNWPQSVMTMGVVVLPLMEPHSIILSKTRKVSSVTCPTATCLPSSHGASVSQMKNWLALVSLPPLAIDTTPGESCLTLKFSSANDAP